MKAYTNKTHRIDDRKCLFSAIIKDSKGRKKAVRQTAKKETESELILMN